VRWLLAILGALAAALIVGVFLNNHPGEFILTLGQTTLQASFAFFMAALLFLSTLLALLLIMLLGVINLPKNFRRWLHHRHSRLAETFLSQGLLSAASGDWRKAESAFRKGASYSRKPMLNYLHAAKAAQQQGRLPQRDQYLRLAQEQATDATVMVGLTQAELQLQQQNTEQAYATLKELRGHGASRDQTSLLMLQAGLALQEWQGVLDNVQRLRGSRLLPEADSKSYQIAAYTGLIRQAGQSNETGGLEALWLTIPKKLRKETSILAAYVQERLRSADTSDCEPLLRQVLKQQWDPACVRLYGLVQGSNPARQLTYAETLLHEYPRDPMLLLSIARLCRRNSLWGKARSCLEESLAQQASPEVYQELATLLEQEGDLAGAGAYYRKGLQLATGISASTARLPRPRVQASLTKLSN